jgi:hypothetical protein
MNVWPRAVTAIVATALALGLMSVGAAVMLGSAATAGTDAARQRVSITSQAAGTTDRSPFVLVPLQSGTIKVDSGTAIATWSEKTVIRDGQEISITPGVATYKGKRGTLRTRFRIEWVEAGNGYHVGSGTWTVVRGTGQYAGATGGGRSGNVWLDSGPWSGQAEGFLTLP